MIRKFSAALILLSLFAFAAPVEGKNKVEPYLRAKDLPDAMIFLPSPPEPGSMEFVLDEARHKWGKGLRDTPRGTRAIREATTDPDTMALMFSEAFGRELSREATPNTMRLIDRSIKTFRAAAALPKQRYMRKRPYVYYEEGTLIPEHETYLRYTGSYPSGHTVRGWGMALLLSTLNPERRNELLLAGYEWGQSRVIAGYHWQSDVDAARLLVSATYAVMLSCPEFVKDLELARQELFGTASEARNDNITDLSCKISTTPAFN